MVLPEATQAQLEQVQHYLKTLVTGRYGYCYLLESIAHNKHTVICKR